jgi:hypothetical protein
MKKLIFIMLVLLVATAASGQDYIRRQISFGYNTKAALSSDSLIGTAAGATTGTDYFYMNTLGTKAGGLVASTLPISGYSVESVEFYILASIKSALAMDSTRVTVEISYDNVNWTQITDQSKTTQTTAVITRNGLPKAIGTVVLMAVTTGVTYDPDLTNAFIVKNGSGGGLWLFNNLVTPYIRLKTMSYDDSGGGAGSAYLNAWVTLKKIN